MPTHSLPAFWPVANADLSLGRAAAGLCACSLTLLQIRMPDNLYEMVVEVQEQVVLPLSTQPTARNGPTPERNAE